MTASHRKRLPTFGLRLLIERRERRSFPESFSKNVRDVLDLMDPSGNFNRLFKTSERVECVLALQPVRVVGIDIENLWRNRRDFPSVSEITSVFKHCAVLIHWDMLVKVLTVFGYERVQIDQRLDPLRKAVCHSGNNTPAIGVPTKHNIGQFLPSDEIDDIRDVGIQVDVFR